jgi:ABC-type antimicrobial peptide transport system permease subunit
MITEEHAAIKNKYLTLFIGCLLGTIAGVLLGLFIIKLLGWINGPLGPNPKYVFQLFGLSIFAGIYFGLKVARKFL